MENKIPVPTDNIFKFYALFGLLLFVFAGGALLYVYYSANEAWFSAAPELAALKEKPAPSPAEKVKITQLEKKIRNTGTDKEFFCNCIGVSPGSG